jgi:molybdenum cofactor biosynthesis enzyme MoaA
VDLISREIANGVNDVTLTGGEPMLESDLVAGIVDGLARLSSSIVPALTIVSNGTLWDGGMIRRVASYPGPLKVNISVHTASPFLYDQVTATQGMRDQVINTVRALVAAGVRVKFNAAVMRGINASAGAMLSLLDQASTLGVTSVKFLELLRQANDPKSEALFVGCSEIEGTLQTLGFRRIREIARGVEMTRVDRSGIHAEVKRCSCALGCGRCQGALARNFGPDLKPHCCFWSERGGGGARCAETDRGGSAV